MLSKSLIAGISFFVVALVLSACKGGPTSNTGIGVYTANCIKDPTSTPQSPQCLPGSNLMKTPNVPVWGNETDDYYEFVNGQSMDQTKGTVYAFGHNGNQPLTTGQSGLLVVDNAQSPAFWNLFSLQPWNCGYNTTDSSSALYQGSVYYEGVNWSEYKFQGVLVPDYYSSGGLYGEFDCYTPDLPAASARFAILGSLPNTLTLGSEAPLMTQYGMPLLYVYDKTGSVVVTETATNVSSDGTQATFPFPSSLRQSGYSLAMVNQTGGGVGFAPAGDNLLSIASSQTIAGSPFGVSVATQMTETTVCVNIPEGIPPNTVTTMHCSQSTSNSTIPVVSLYSANQIRIGDGAYVNVGANPTAVVTPAYTAGTTSSTVSNSYGYTTTVHYGSLRAIVANSGSNTISVVDTINDALLYNVTVGNHPVALALSSDNSTVYVANYTDSTVTQVNSTTGTATATVAVGGKPTSVALTSAGTLWVGGEGFLTKINTGTMSVVATEPIARKTILALGFSNSVNELVATTVDTGGHVYADEINPGTFQAGGIYTPLASNMVSSLGTHPIRGAQAQAFTATLTGTSTISSNQVGAPPLVVQDGWAVVTATPTGFTITDITGHVVLVSETTPSPITGIAVDSKLNVAYLVMPDSNTLLTVPLPGTN